MSNKSKETKEQDTKEDAPSSVTLNPAGASSSGEGNASSTSTSGIRKTRKEQKAIALESDDEELLDANIIRSMRRMGIRAPRQYDPLRDTNVEALLARVEYQMAVSKAPDADKTSMLLRLLDIPSFEAGQNLNLDTTTPFDEAKKRLKEYFAVTKTNEELREKHELRHKKPGKTIEAFARDVKLIGHKAFPNKNPELLKLIFIQVFVSGLRDDKSRKRVLLKSPKTLMEATQFVRFSEAAVRVAKRSTTPSTSTVNKIG